MGKLHDLEEFLSSCGSSLETFRYFSKRPLSVIKNHIVTLLGYDDNDIPVAYGHLDEEGGEVWLGICVSEGNQGEGYGRTMMQSLLEFARENKLHSIALSVDEVNSKAAQLYKEFGFQLEKQAEGICWYRLKLGSEKSSIS